MWHLPSDQPLAQNSRWTSSVSGVQGSGGLASGLPATLWPPLFPLFLATVLLLLFGSSLSLWSPWQ